MIQLLAAGVRFGEQWIWRDATLTIPARGFTVVIGANGAGKSTLLSVVLGLLPLSEGRACVDGDTPRRGNPSIGYMPQLRALDSDLPIRGRDLVRFGIDGHRWGISLNASRARARELRVEAAIDAVSAGGYADRRIGSLSGGEAQRLYLAQALVGQPRLLVLDEPLAGLDVANQAEMLALTARIARECNVAVLLVAHNLDGLLPYADRVVYIARGRIASGTPDEIVTSEALSRIYDAPMEVLYDSLGRPHVTGSPLA